MHMEKAGLDATVQLAGTCKNRKSQLVFNYIVTIVESDIGKYYGVETWREMGC